MGTLRSVCHAWVFQVRCLAGQSRKSLCKRGFCNDKRQSCFCVRGCNREQPSPFKKRWKKIRLEISWNYKAITWTATLTRTEWKKIIEGVQFVKAGDGFMGEDGSHQDMWLFNYKGPASLEVEYEDNAQGFIGDIDDALIEVL